MTTIFTSTNDICNGSKHIHDLYNDQIYVNIAQIVRHSALVIINDNTGAAKMPLFLAIGHHMMLIYIGTKVIYCSLRQTNTYGSRTDIPQS
jgi:hypothetical protein